MTKRKVILGILVLTFTSLILTLFLLKSKSKVQEENEEEKLLIGFCTDTMVIERWQKDRDIFTAKAKEAGFDIITLNANEDNERQKEQVRYLIDKNVDVIVIIPYDKEGLTEVIQEAKKKGIIVIAYDRLILNANVDAYVSFDNIKVGEYMAEYLYEKVPEGNYVIINGSPHDNNSAMFNEGFKNILNKGILKGEIHILKEVWADDWREDVAYNTITQLLQEDKKIDAIIGANDRLAEGAISALTEYGLAGDVLVVGHDADISACQRIVEGTQLMTVYKPIKTLAEGTVELIVKMIENKKIDNVELINDGKYFVPYIKFNVIPVTENNMKETIIKDGFHSEEDVYRNIEEGIIDYNVKDNKEETKQGEQIENIQEEQEEGNKNIVK